MRRLKKDLDVPGGSASYRAAWLIITNRLRGADDKPMQQLTYVLTGIPDRVSERLEEVLGDWYRNGGRCAHLSREPRQDLPVPSHIVYEDGLWLSKRDVGDEGMKKALESLEPADQILVVGLHY